MWVNIYFNWLPQCTEIISYMNLPHVSEHIFLLVTAETKNLDEPSSCEWTFTHMVFHCSVYLPNRKELFQWSHIFTEMPQKTCGQQLGCLSAGVDVTLRKNYCSIKFGGVNTRLGRIWIGLGPGNAGFLINWKVIGTIWYHMVALSAEENGFMIGL